MKMTKWTPPTFREWGWALTSMFLFGAVVVLCYHCIMLNNEVKFFNELYTNCNITLHDK